MIFIHIYEEFSLTGGGVRSVVADVSAEMARLGENSIIISLNPPADKNIDEINIWSEKKSVKVLILNQREEGYIRCIRSIRSYIKEISSIDKCCLFLHLKRGMLAGILSTLFMNNIKRVEVYHSGYMNYKIQSFLSRPFIDHYISVSKDAKRQLIEDFSINSDKISVVYNGINPDYVRSLVEIIPRNKDIVRLLSVGRLSYEKGFSTSLNAYAILRKELELDKTEYIMIGDGPDKSECLKLSNGYVSLLGMLPRNSVYSYMSSADVIITPSLWEGNSIVLLEVLAIGCAVVATDIPAYREVLGNEPLHENEQYRIEKFGVVFKKNSVEACKASIKAIYDNRDKIPYMKKFVAGLSDQYTVKKQARKYMDIANMNN